MRLQQEPTLDIVAEAEDGETAIDLAKQQSLDLVLLDVGLPGLSGLEACRQIKRQHPELPVLVLTSHSQPSLVTQLIELGANGYCLKGVPAETLILAIRSVAAGASWWDQTATQTIRSAVESSPSHQNAVEATPPSPVLTPREQEILSLMATGKSNQEIAEALYITPGTVRVHVHAILQKLDVRDRTQAAIIALQNRLLTQHSSV